MASRSSSARDDALLLAALRGGDAAGAQTRRRGRAASLRGEGGGEGRGLFYWLPVAVALGLFSQVALLGLKPAVRESARLGAAEEVLLERHRVEQARGALLQRILQAQSDPIYLERERRLLQDPESGLLRR